jgi:putative transposase
MDYRRALYAGGTYFFTLNLLKRKDNDLLVKHVDVLKNAIKQAKQAHPFIIHA